MSRSPSLSSNSTDSANPNAGPNATPDSANLHAGADSANLNAGPNATSDTPESISGDTSINMWRPDPSGFLAELGLGPNGLPLSKSNEGSVGQIPPTPDLTKEQRATQAALWYYTSAASSFDKEWDEKFVKEYADKKAAKPPGKLSLKQQIYQDVQEFRTYAQGVLTGEFGLPKETANQILTWSGNKSNPDQPVKRDGVESEPESGPDSYAPDTMKKVQETVLAKLQSIPGNVPRDSEPPEQLMPKMVDTKTMIRLMQPAYRGGPTGSLKGNSFTIAHGRHTGYYGGFGINKGIGAGKTLVQAAVAMGLFNKTGSKVKFNLKGGPQELQNKFSAILDEIERYDLPLDKCKFTLPGNFVCPDIASLKKALQDPSHPLSRAPNYGAGGAAAGRNKLLMRIQAMENKVTERKKSGPDAPAPNVNMVHCTQATILTRAIPDGMTARQKEAFAQDLKNMDPTARKQVIKEAAANIDKTSDPAQRSQQLDGLLEVVVATYTGSNTARKMMGPDITGSMGAYESYAQNVAAITNIIEGTSLQGNLIKATDGLQERAGIENMDPSRGRVFMQIQNEIEGGPFKYSRSMTLSKTYVDAETLATTQESGQRHIDKLDSEISKLQQEVDDISNAIVGDTSASSNNNNQSRQYQIATIETQLSSLRKSQQQALASLSRSAQPLEYVVPRWYEFTFEEKLAGLQAARKTNFQLFQDGGIKLLGLKADRKRLEDEIKTAEAVRSTYAWVTGWGETGQKLQRLEDQKKIVDQKISLYETAAANLVNIDKIVASTQYSQKDDQSLTKAQLLTNKNELQDIALDYASGKPLKLPPDPYSSDIYIVTELEAEELKVVDNAAEKDETSTNVRSVEGVLDQPEPDKDAPQTDAPQPPAVDPPSLPPSSPPPAIPIPQRGINFTKKADGLTIQLTDGTNSTDYTVTKDPKNSGEWIIKEKGKPTDLTQKTLEQTITDFVTSNNDAGIANSTSVWEAVQRMVVDSDKKSGVDAGAIKIYSSKYLEENDGLKTIEDRYAKATTSNEQNEQLAIQGAFRVKQKEGLKVGSSRDYVAGALISRTTVAKNTIAAKVQTFSGDMQTAKEKAAYLDARIIGFGAGAATAATAAAQQSASKLSVLKPEK